MTDAPLKLPPINPKRVVYFGTPQIAVKPLAALVSAGFDVALVVTRPDARRGRRSKPTPNPVKLAAQGLGIPVSHELDDALEVQADIGVVVAYGRIIPRRVLEDLALINIHYSLLPKWRGAAPLERALMEGDSSTGVCIMAIEPELDTGPIYSSEEIEIDSAWDLGDLADACTEAGCRKLVEVLSDGSLSNPVPQTGEPSYAAMLSTDEFRVTEEDSVQSVINRLKVRPCWFMLEGKRVKVLDAQPSSGEGLPAGTLNRSRLGLSDGVVEIIELQPEGKRSMAADSWLQSQTADARIINQ